MKTFGHGEHVSNQVWTETGSNKLHPRHKFAYLMAPMLAPKPVSSLLRISTATPAVPAQPALDPDPSRRPRSGAFSGSASGRYQRRAEREAPTCPTHACLDVYSGVAWKLAYICLMLYVQSPVCSCPFLTSYLPFSAPWGTATTSIAS